MNKVTSPKRVLNIDDDPMIRCLIHDMLSGSEYEVHPVASATEALNFLSTQLQPLDLYCILLDVNMPDISGLDLLRQLKQQDSTRHIPVIMITCQTAPDDYAAGYSAGAAYYIGKPFTREQLLHGLGFVYKAP